MTSQLAFVIGFERSGTSMVARLLARHPAIECFMQPDAGTAIEHAQWRPWHEPAEAPAEVCCFVDGLAAGRIDREFLRADWFDRDSSARAFVPGRLHLVKSTKLEAQLPWLATRLPAATVWGVLRRPHDVLASLRRNGFDRSWYRARDEAALRALAERGALPAALAARVCAARGELELLAARLAVKRHWLVAAVPPARLLHYEDVVADPDRELGRVLAHHRRAGFEFARFAGEDLNLVGLPPTGEDHAAKVFSPAERVLLDDWFPATEEALDGGSGTISSGTAPATL